MDATQDRALTFINADIMGTDASTLRVCDGRIAALGLPPRTEDFVIDLRGDRLFPGLINAHDHLQLNHFPRLEYKDYYHNAREWIEDFNTRIRVHQTFTASAAISRDERLLLGGIKNLLSGVTTVAHHDPLYPSLSNPHFPIRVVSHCGWSHSLPIDGEENVSRSYRGTPVEWPWIIHVAEGTDEVSATEFDRLEALGCVQPNTLIVHGVALDPQQRARLARAGAGLIWCPTSNVRLFGKTLEATDLIRGRCLGIGSDSRLTGSRDLLDELCVAAALGELSEPILETLATQQNARLLKLTDRGSLVEGALADLLVLPRELPLSKATRSDVRLVMVDGVMRYGDPEFAFLADFLADSPVEARSRWAHVRVDGHAKLLDRTIAALLWTSHVREDGLELPDDAWGAACA